MQNSTALRPTLSSLRKRVLLFAALLLAQQVVFAQTDCPGFASLRHRKVTGISIGNAASPRFKGLLEFTPAGYNPADLATLYPVIIFFHGREARGEGTASDLCKIFSDQPFSLPGRLENGTAQETALVNGVPQSFIFISPQYVNYDYPTNFPSANAVDSVIDYVLANYRVNPNRIYLTGMSAGANMVVEYAGSSQARASRIAAASTASICSQVGVNPNSPTAPANIANGALPFWFLQCQSDGSCPVTIPSNWYNGIISTLPAASAYTKFTQLIPIPSPLPPIWPPANINDYCHPFGHDTWSKMYDRTFTNGGLNVYDWFIQYQRNALVPVVLKQFTARLNSGKVFLNWSTTRETNAARYIIERAGADQRFQEWKTIPAAGNSSRDQQYALTDDQPQAGLNYYRLVQEDADQRKHYFSIRSVMNAGLRTGVEIVPNPAKNLVNFYFNLNRPGPVTLTITDAAGKLQFRQTYTLQEGNTGIPVSIEKYSAGLYYVQFQSAELMETRKLIKQ